MKKKILIGVLLLVVCFWHFNVKASELVNEVVNDESLVNEVQVNNQSEEVQEDERMHPRQPL